MQKSTVIVYHEGCPDGFGGAFAAWKKFGDAAEYIPKRHGEEPPTTLAGRDVYMIDFSYPKDVLQRLAAEAKSFVILDHHSGAREAVESIPNHIFDNDRSGASIAWSYFHPGTPLPRMFAYVEDNDLWRHTMPHCEEVAAYLHTVPMTFEAWEKAVADFDDDTRFTLIIEKGASYKEYNDYIIADLASDAELVEFEGYTIYAVNAPPLFRSKLGNTLALRQPPFAIVWYEQKDVFRCSLRGIGEVNLAELAGRYGGNGHHDSASFRIKAGTPFPWKKV